MANTIVQDPSSGSAGQAIARIVGLICVIGFIADVLGLILPPGSGASWRFGLFQQVGDRSIVFLFGIALLIYGCWENQLRRKPLSYAALGLGVAYLLTCVLVVSDGFKVQSQAAANIDQRVEQLQTRIEQSRNNPEISAKAKPEDFDNALKSIESQAYTAAENARNSVTKSSIVIASNFLIVGVGLLSLGRFGIGSSLNKSSHGRFKVRRA
jgi:hypothetical protein